MSIILASTSAARQALMQRLQLKFICDPPLVDESPRPQEPIAALVRRLAHAKVQAIAVGHTGSLVVGADQMAALGTHVLGKPGSHENAVVQLRAASGRTMDFYTGLCVLDTRTHACYEHLDTTRVHFRPLADAEIDRYLRSERPYDCAGSFKSEGLGISLFHAIESRDPTALVGLPLIALCQILRTAGVILP